MLRPKLGVGQGGLAAVALGALTVIGCGGSSAAQGKATGGMTSAVDNARCDSRGKQLVTSDTNGDKRADVMKLYETVGSGSNAAQKLVCKQVDLNNDNKIDIVYHYAPDSSNLTFEEFDLDFDGRFDLRAFYQSGRKIREEMDTNYDNKVDFTKYYEADRLVRIERDSNNDGRVDEWQYYEAGKLDRIGYDSTGSGRVDKWERAPEAEAGVTGAETTPAPPATQTQGVNPSGAGVVPAGGTAPAPNPATAPTAPPAAPR
jgi:hypothetical protein